MIFKNIFAEKLAKKLAFFTHTTASFFKNIVHNIGLWENRQFFAENWKKSLKFVIITSSPGHGATFLSKCTPRTLLLLLATSTSIRLNLASYSFYTCTLLEPLYTLLFTTECIWDPEWLIPRCVQIKVEFLYRDEGVEAAKLKMSPPAGFTTLLLKLEVDFFGQLLSDNSLIWVYDYILMYIMPWHRPSYFVRLCQVQSCQ
jgi:hypothetical protein